MRFFYNLTGMRFGRWLVIGRNPENGTDNSIRWDCVCDCGSEATVNGRDLKKGKSKSCGCLKIEQTVQRFTKHGCSLVGHETREYKTWQNMKTRCTNTNNEKYKDYGARGISVCDKWINDFNAFLLDMGKAPPGYTIERIDNNGNYEPGNCKWATPTEQQHNRRNNHWIEFGGKRMILIDWAKYLGIHYVTLIERISKHPIEKALTPGRWS